MKRVIKLFLNLVLASIAVGLTLLVVFLITPSWQKLFVEETLSRDSARRWQVGFRAGLAGLGSRGSGGQRHDRVVGRYAGFVRLPVHWGHA